jgi:simple sugar transport system permease protein
VTGRPPVHLASRVPQALRTLLRRPELGVAAGAVATWAVFAVAAGAPFRSAAGTAAFLNAAAPLGILAVAVALLMIAGEFDLSVGSLVGAAGMLLMLLTMEAGWPLWPAVAATAAFCAAVGLVNGWLVIRTGLPSFIVTLATLFILRGLAIAVPRAVTGRTQISGLDGTAGYDVARAVFAADIGLFRISIAWWIALAALGTWVLLRTRAGNWIFAAGGGPEAARNLGVPVARVKVSLFVTTALAAGLVAVIQAVRFTGADALRGEMQEFRAIIAAVIGGTLLTGGYGSAVGAVFGALIFGMVRQGIVITGIDADWFQVILGALLLGAVLFNQAARRRLAERGRDATPAASGGVRTPGPSESAAPSDGLPGPGSRSSGVGSREAADIASVLAARGVTRRFGRVTALEDVTIELHAGRVTCLLGDNGAGKSTLIKVLAGVHPPSEGRVELAGAPVALASPRDAHRRGVATVYQDLAVIPLMDVWRNFWLGRERTVGRGPLRRLDVAACRSATREALAAFAIGVEDVDRPLGTLSGGERQSVAIARAVHEGARVLILDEPTAALGVRQAGLVLDRVRRVRDAGVAVLLVTHNPRDALEVGDAFVVLRHGRVSARLRREEADLGRLVTLMSGRAGDPGTFSEPVR